MREIILDARELTEKEFWMNYLKMEKGEFHGQGNH